MSKNIKFRKYKSSLAPSLKPLIIGYHPTTSIMKFLDEHEFKELPGYWLYHKQFEYKGKLGRLAGRLFGLLYSEYFDRHPYKKPGDEHV